MLLSTDFFRPENTAIRRAKPSPFARYLVESGYLLGRNVQHILDYGCGTGVDVMYYRSMGFSADGFDPYKPFGWNNPIRRESYDFTICMFVLNVISEQAERHNILERVKGLTKAGGFSLLVTRSTACIEREANKKRWNNFEDGYISSASRRTFQRGFSKNELIAIFGEGWVTQEFEFKGSDFCSILSRRQL